MIKKALSISLIILIYSCATVQSPTGGDKDTKNPILYESDPKDQSINFNKEKITLFFNEWMKLEQLDKELIITPREDIKYEATLNKQELTIELEEKLKDSVTYTFNFRKALKDITEGNLWENPIIAFSTGPYLDSLQISGTVSNIKTTAASSNYVVGLYSSDYDTANLRQGKPVYFTTTDKVGYYQMNNLKEGRYKLFTFEDKNNNLINDPQTEPYGFHDQVIELYDSIAPYTLNTYLRNEDTLKLRKYSPVGKDFIIQYNKGLSQYSITNPKDSDQFIYANNVEASKYIKIYKDNFPKLEYETDSIQLLINVKDSIGSKLTDTVYFKTRQSRLTNDSIKIQTTPKPNIISGPQKFTIDFTKPVQTVNYDSIQLRIDDIPIQLFTQKDLDFNFNRKEITLSTLILQDSIQILIDSIEAEYQKSAKDTANTKPAKDSTITEQTAPLLEDQSISPNTQSNTSQQKTKDLQLQLYLGKAAFTGIENDSTKPSITRLSFMDPQNYGIIKGKVIQADFPFVIQLLNEKYEVQDTIVNQQEYQFNYVKPGKYRLRIIKDENDNQMWDAGNPLLLQQEEQYYHYQDILTVKANWEVIDQNFDFSVDKDVDKGVKDEDL